MKGAFSAYFTFLLPKSSKNAVEARKKLGRVYGESFINSTSKLVFKISTLKMRHGSEDTNQTDE